MDRQWLETLSDAELERLVREGRITREEADEIIQARERRAAAERDPEELPDPTERKTAGGFGSGQGMGVHSTGQEPGAYDEQGKPRHEDLEWPG
ncbi:MAG: hypothetical protein QJR03_09405 [Sphaerobacter sp.]|nr:hypothetical protein [Sphaerobacter sp.]